MLRHGIFYRAMSKYLFYEADMPLQNATATFTEANYKHAIQVLRLKVGDAVHITNGLGYWAQAIVQSVEKKYASYVIQQVHHAEPTVGTKLILAVAPTKNLARLEWLLEKVVEMGVHTVVPVITKRTEKVFVKQHRLQQIAISAMLQSHQYSLPIIAEPIAFEQCLATYTQQLNCIAHCSTPSKVPLHTIEAAASMLMLIGPEGDFTNEEIAYAYQQQCIGVSIGTTRLRTETAAMVATALVLVK